MMTGSFGSVWKTKVVGFGTDSASVMMGSNNGTVKKIVSTNNSDVPQEQNNRLFLKSLFLIYTW